MASTTRRGTWVPAGLSRKTQGRPSSSVRARAGNCARTPSTSSMSPLHYHPSRDKAGRARAASGPLSIRGGIGVLLPALWSQRHVHDDVLVHGHGGAGGGVAAHEDAHVDVSLVIDGPPHGQAEERLPLHGGRQV